MSHKFLSSTRPVTLFLYVLFCVLLASCQDLSYKTRDELFHAEQTINNDSVEEGLERLETMKSRYDNGSSLTKYRFILAYMYAQHLMGYSITNDSILERALHFCEKNASTNAQTKARYLLGCCYMDKKQYSMGQQWFLKAAEKADTLIHDFDYSILFHTYEQLGQLYRKEHSPTIAVEAYHKAGFYALKMNDSIKWAGTLLGTASCKFQVGDWDKCMELCQTALPYLYRKENRYTQEHQQIAHTLICASSIETGNLKYAKLLLDSMRTSSSLVHFGKNTRTFKENIEDCQIRYLIKTKQWNAAKSQILNAERNASKERKAVLMKHDAEIYYATGNKDSAFTILSTYAVFADSTLSQCLAQEMQQFQHTINRMDVLRQIDKSKEEQTLTIIGCTISILLLAGLFMGAYFRNRKRFKVQLEMFITKNKELKEQRELLRKLKETNETDFKHQIQQLEEKLAAKETDLSTHLQQIPSKIVAEETLSKFKLTEVYQNINSKVRHNERITDDELQTVYDILPECLPQVYRKVSSCQELQRGALFKTLIFTLLQIRGKDIARQCFCEAHAISMNKARINELLFGLHTAKNLLRNLLETD